MQRTGEEWGNLVRQSFPGYKGRRPRIQLMHGTSDGLLNFRNLHEEVKQWTNVLALNESPSETDSPIVDYNRKFFSTLK